MNRLRLVKGVAFVLKVEIGLRVCISFVLT